MCQMLKAELKKLSFIPYLILSISGIVLLCLSATGETDIDFFFDISGTTG